jgi:hypothetical protein
LNLIEEPEDLMMKGNLLLIAGTLLASTICMNATSSSEPAENSASGGVIEVLTLDIKPGRRDEFHKVYVTESVPLLKKWNFDVVAYGPSLHDANSYYVIRRFKSLDDREKSEEAFYSSDDWRQGPRDSIMGLVEHFAYAVVSAETWKKISAGVTNPDIGAK